MHSPGLIRTPAWQAWSVDTLELIFVFMLLGLLYGLAARLYGASTLAARSAAVEALALSVSQKLCMQESWAVAGRFPAASDCIDGAPRAPGARASGNYVSAVVAPGAAPSFEYLFGKQLPMLDGKHLDVWLTAGPGEFPATWSWRCGPVLPAPGMSALGSDHTTLPALALPSPCRAAIHHVSPR